MAPAWTFYRIPVTIDLHGGEIALAIHDITGARDGPTLAILSTLHGGEWLAFGIADLEEPGTGWGPAR